MAGSNDPSLDDILRAAKLPVGPNALPPSMARGVDLAAIRDKKNYQHRWVVMARYLLDDDQMAMVQHQIDEANRQHKENQAAGLPSPDNVPVNVPLEAIMLTRVEGPGCQKCNVHMAAPNGYGHLCEKSDKDFPPELVQEYVDKAASKAELDALIEQSMAERQEGGVIAGEIGPSDGSV